jgi:hypothetical protein
MKSRNVHGVRTPVGKGDAAARRDEADGERCKLQREADGATAVETEEREGESSGERLGEGETRWDEPRSGGGAGEPESICEHGK